MAHGHPGDVPPAGTRGPRDRGHEKSATTRAARQATAQTIGACPQPILTPNTMAGGVNVTRRARSVFVLFHSVDRDVADFLAASLEAQGLDVEVAPRVPAPRGLVVVAVMSPTALEDPQWLASADAFRGQRVVPVAADREADYERAPDFLREINWVFWAPEAAAASAALVFRAAVTDIVEYRGQRSLETRALVWRAVGGDPDQLIGDVRQARQAVALSSSGAASLRPENAALVQAFALESLLVARRRRRKRRWRLGRAILAAVLLVGVPAYVLVGKVHQIQSDTDLMAGAMSGAATRPDLVAVKWAGIADLVTPSEADLAQHLVLPTMYESWGTGAVAWDGLYVINDVAFTEDPHRSFTVDGQGAVALWDLPRARVLDRVLVANVPLYFATVSPGGRWLAAAGAGVVYLIDTRSWTSQAWTSPGEPAMLAVSQDGSTVSWITASGGLATAKRGRADVIVAGPTTARGLAVASAAASGTTALLRVGNELRLIEPETSRVLARHVFPKAMFEVAALSDDGRKVAVTGSDGQLWSGDGHLTLHPTGQAIPDLLTALSVSDRGWILFASDQFGAQVISPDEELMLGGVCPGSGTTSRFSLRGDVGVCVPNMRTFDLKELLLTTAPTGADRDSVNQAGAAHSSRGTLSAAALDPRSGGFTWSIDGRFTDHPAPNLVALSSWPALPSDSRATSVAISPSGNSLAVGTSTGWVLEFDVRRRADRNAWSLVENGRTHVIDGSALAGLGYASSPGHLFALTASGHWFDLFDCAGCSDRSVMIDRIAARRWNMYPDSLLNLLSEETRVRLNLQPLPTQPNARRP